MSGVCSAAVTEREALPCRLCSAEFVARTGLVRHTAYVHGKCGLGGDESPARLPALHPGDGNAPNKCGVCGASFWTERMRLLHERMLHGDGVPVSCAHCARPFGHVADLNRHVLEEHQPIDRGYAHACTKCAQTAYPTAVQLRRHEEAVHGVRAKDFSRASSASPVSDKR